MSKAHGILVPLMVLVVASACGSGSGKEHSPTASSPSKFICVSLDDDVVVDADLLGDSSAATATFTKAGGPHCPASLTMDSAALDPKNVYATTVADLPIAGGGFRAVTIPGRTGQLVLLIQTNPRGGYQAHLFGYANKKFEELKVEGHPAFPFVATDTSSAHLSAACEDNGYEIRVAKQSGKRTWDISRTVYQISGNTVTAGETTQVGHDISELDLQNHYGDIATDDVLTDCP